mmetsp:Transcript_14638/g.42909  ORF Transcript_14638/g.42909 Transcript_14638/m.42909 type:complete len:203 (+) Transcript_14638:99-707(+)
MWRDVRRRRRRLWSLWISSRIPPDSPSSERKSPRAPCCADPLVPVRPSSPRPSRERRPYPSSPSPDRISSRCSSAWARRVSVIYSRRRGTRLRALYSSMRSMPWAGSEEGVGSAAVTMRGRIPSINYWWRWTDSPPPAAWWYWREPTASIYWTRHSPAPDDSIDRYRWTSRTCRDGRKSFWCTSRASPWTGSPRTSPEDWPD